MLAAEHHSNVLPSPAIIIRTVQHMALAYHPKPGQILICDFSYGFVAPEMVKRRPVVVLTPSMQGRGQLTTVAALSTVKPDQIRAYNLEIPAKSMPMLGLYQGGSSWLKGDMIYSVGFHRLDPIRLKTRGPDGKRQYFTQRFGRERMRDVYACVLEGLNLGHVTQHI